MGVDNTSSELLKERTVLRKVAVLVINLLKAGSTVAMAGHFFKFR